MNSEPGLPANVLEAIHARRKIDAIKLLREQRNIGLKEAKQLVDAYARDHPHLVSSRRSGPETGMGRLALVGLFVLAVYLLYRFFA